MRLWWSQRNRTLLPVVFAETAPLDLRIVGRMLFHAALVGAAAGFAGAAFFAAVEYLQRFLLEDLAGYTVAARTRRDLRRSTPSRGCGFRPWLLVAAARPRRSGLRSLDAARAGDARRWRRRHDRGVPSPGRRHPAARDLGEGAGVAVHARHRRCGRSRRSDDADRRRARVVGGPGSRGECAREAHPAGGGCRRRNLGGVPHAARRGAPRRGGPLPRRLRGRRARPLDSRQRRRVLGRHLDLRREHALRSHGALSVRARASAAVRR